MSGKWEAVKEGLKARLTPTVYQLWIEPLQAVAGEAGEYYLDCPNAFFVHWIQNHYLAEIVREWERQEGQTPLLKLRVAPAPPKPQVEPPAEQLVLPGLEPGRPFGRRLNHYFTFDSFVVGASNRLAFQASRALAANDPVFGSTVFLAAQPGLGKSHLSQAVGNYLRAHSRRARVFYLTAEDFANEMIAALRAGQMAGFKERFRTQCDVLLLEGVHFLSGKDKIQAELCYTLDYLIDTRKKIVLTSSYLPTEIPQLRQELVSRFSGGVITPIDPPDFNTRVRILLRRIRERQARVPQEVVEYLAAHLTTDVRQMLSALDNLLLKSSALGIPPTLELAAEVLQGFAAAARVLQVEDILKLVGEVYGLKPEELLSRSRQKRVVKARNLAIYLCRQYLQKSLPELGRAFRRSHSTVLHALEGVERDRKTLPALAQELAYLEQRLQNSPAWRRTLPQSSASSSGH